MSYNIGIDIGTSSVKVLAVDASGRALGLEKEDYPILTPEPGYKEQEPDKILEACLSACSRLIRSLKGAPRSIGLSSAMHSLVGLDRSGAPVTNAILWADTRSQGLAERLRASTEGKAIYEATGTPLHALSPLLKIRWLREHQPGVFRRITCFADIKTYVVFRLTGHLFMDYSMASATGLMNIHRRKWHDAALAYAGISADRLPRLVDTSFRLPSLQGGMARRLTLSVDIPWIIGGSDGCLANLGSFAFDPQTLALSAGTSAALRFTAPAPVLNFEGQPFSYYLDAERQVVGGASNNGGVVVNWFSAQFYPGENMSRLLTEATATAPAAEGVLFLPWLLGERAPVWDTRASGVFLGLRDTHGRAHLARAVLEGVAFNLYRIFQDVQENNEAPIERIISSGGLSRAPVWNQILADVFGLPVLTIRQTESSALGAIMLARRATGQISDYQELAAWRQVEQTFHPQKEHHQRYQGLQPLVANLYRQLQTSFFAIAKMNQ